MLLLLVEDIDRRTDLCDMYGERLCTYGCAACIVIRLQPALHAVAACIVYGCSLHYLRLQSALCTVAACIAHGCSLQYIRLQAALHTVAGLVLVEVLLVAVVVQHVEQCRLARLHGQSQ